MKAGKIFAKKIPAVTFLFLAASPLVVIWYAAYIFNVNNADNLFLYSIQIIADSIAMMVLLGLWLTVLIDTLIERHHRTFERVNFSLLSDDNVPTVDVFITVYGEPLSVIEKTARAARDMRVLHNTYVLDDGNSFEVRYFCEQNGIKYIAREKNDHAKAGNVNNALSETDAEFFAIIDADHVPEPEFLEVLLPYMEDKNLAMVQSPQHYRNIENFIASGTAQAQEVFYRYVCPAKNISNSAFSVGTNVLFRRSAIDQIGGIALNNSEDIWTSFLLHKNGWRTIFVNQVLAIGVAPDTIISFFKQQRRWAKGGLDILINESPMRNEGLELDQRIQYFISSTFFLVGIPILVYIVMPIIYLLFDEKPLLITNGTVWLIHYLPYFFLYFAITFLLLRQKLRISTMATALANFYPYLLGLFSVIFDTEQEWVATTSKKNSVDPIMKWIWPHVFLLVLSILSLIVGWYNPTEFWASFFNSMWVGLNIFLLSTFLTRARYK